MQIIESIFKKYPEHKEMPCETNYMLAMLVKNMAFLAIFMYCHPNEITLNWLEFCREGLLTKVYVCPCGDVFMKWQLHYIQMNSTSTKTKAVHSWMFEEYKKIESAARGKIWKNVQSNHFGKLEKIPEYFSKVWKELAIPEYKNDMVRKEKLLRIF
jgi:hypothetical protein